MSDTIAVPGEPDTWGDEHERVIRWHDPGPTLALSRTMSGMEYIQAVVDGRLPAPPIAHTTLASFTRAEPGDVEFRCTPDASLQNPLGMIHGGLHSTLLDSVMGCALHTLIPVGTTYTTIEMKVSFMKAVRPGDELVAHGWVVKSGRRVTFAEGSLKTADGTLVATASESMLVISGA